MAARISSALFCQRITQHVFVECKHYEKGVPPEKLQGALAWARVNRPDVLLIIVSGFLSNPCKDYIEGIRNNERPPFTIEWWERPKLEELTNGRPKLLAKYGILGDEPFIKLLHPLHLEYIRSQPLNTLRYLFEILDRLEHGERKEIMFGAFLHFINPSTRPPENLEQTMAELSTIPVTYTEFQRKCIKLTESISDILLIRCVIRHTASELFRFADRTTEQEMRERHFSMIEFFEDRLAQALNPNERKDILSCIDGCREMLESMPQRYEMSYVTYVSFCERIIAPLFTEPPQRYQNQCIKQLLVDRYGSDDHGLA